LRSSKQANSCSTPLWRVALVSLVMLAGNLGTAAEHDDDGPAPATSVPPPKKRAVVPPPPSSISRKLVSSGIAGLAVNRRLRRLGPCSGACEVNWYAGRLWIRPEYLAWDMKGFALPALLTTGSATTDPSVAGQLDQPDTVTLFGDGSLHGRLRSGGRLNAGFWCTPRQFQGFELNYFGVQGYDTSYQVDSNEFAVLARPFQNATNGQPDAQLIAYPNLLDDDAVVRVDVELAGTDIFFRKAMVWTPSVRIDFLSGYRYGRLRDEVHINSSSTSLDAASGEPVNTMVDQQDRFRMVNNFHGGEVGLLGRWWYGCWSCQILAKVALGGVQSRYGIRGSTTISELLDGVSVPTDYEGGVLALPTNMGSGTSYDTSVLSELGIRLEYQLGTNMRIALGYTFLGWSNVVRVSSIINTEINPTQIPPGSLVGGAAPDAPSLHRTSFWAQGLNASWEYQF
jgi:hypothetical protein